jgi:hypothetical protein
MYDIWKLTTWIGSVAVLLGMAGCGGGAPGSSSGAPTFNCQTGGPPTVALDTPPAGANQLSGHVCNVDPARTKVVLYVLTNQWYVQPLVSAPYTSISAAGIWANSTHPWDHIVVLLVDPATYQPAATKITNPALDAGVLAWTQFPLTGPASLEFSGRTWGIKVAADPFDPGRTTGRTILPWSASGQTACA